MPTPFQMLIAPYQTRFLAQQVGVSEGTVCGWRKGRLPQGERLEAIAAATRKTLAEVSLAVIKTREARQRKKGKTP